MNKSSLVLEVLTFNNQYIVSLLESGRCSIHDKRKFFLHYYVNTNLKQQTKPNVISIQYILIFL